MAKASLHLELTNATVKAGEPVRGAVIALAQADGHCKGITVRKRWFAHGDGITQHGPWSEEKIVATADWTAGMEYRYPFELPTDTAPVSYHGKLLHVDWVLQASADLPWALDPSAEIPFLVIPGVAPASWNVAAPPPGSRRYSSTALALSFGGLGIVIALFGVAQLVERPLSSAWFLVAVGAVLAAIGLFGPIRRRMAEKAIGHPEVRVDPSTARAGTVVVARFRSRPPKPVTLTGAFVRVYAHETVTTPGGGRSSSTRSHDVEMGTVRIEAARIPTSPAIELEVSLTLPADAPPSFSTSHNHLSWFVQVSIGIEGEPNWAENFPLLVQ